VLASAARAQPTAPCEAFTPSASSVQHETTLARPANDDADVALHLVDDQSRHSFERSFMPKP
jgi:hypothetical protein